MTTGWTGGHRRYNGRAEQPWGGWLSWEDASVEGGVSKVEWITAKFAELERHPEIKAFVWFNHNKEVDWRIQSSEAARQSFANGVANNRYG